MAQMQAEHQRKISKQLAHVKRAGKIKKLERSIDEATLNPEYDHTDSRTLLATIEKRHSKGLETQSFKKDKFLSSGEDYQMQAIAPKRYSVGPSLGTTVNKSIDAGNKRTLKFTSPNQKNLSVSNLHSKEEESPREEGSRFKYVRESGMSEAGASSQGNHKLPSGIRYLVAN